MRPSDNFASIMPTRRHRKPDRRRALELLASCPDGCTEAILLAHGFTTAQMVELVRAGLASVSAERVVAGRTTVEIARVKITEAGRLALKS
jgi:ABC-type amino acid transport system permease subunit